MLQQIQQANALGIRLVKMYPVYQGAVVVCQGAGNSQVRLTVIDAVSVLTGLSSDKISVVKWKN